MGTMPQTAHFWHILLRIPGVKIQQIIFGIHRNQPGQHRWVNGGTHLHHNFAGHGDMLHLATSLNI